MVLGHLYPNKEIGETPASDPSLLINRVISVTAMDVTDNLEKYYIKLYFRILKHEDGKAIAYFDGSECLRDYIARMVMRRTTRIDVVQDVNTKDNHKIRVKTIIVAPGKITRSIQKALRKTIQELVEQIVSNETLEKFVKNMLSDKYHKKIIKELSKVYPVRSFEFRKIEVLERPDSQKQS